MLAGGSITRGASIRPLSAALWRHETACAAESGYNVCRLVLNTGIRIHGLFVPKQSRRTCPDLGEAKPGISFLTCANALSGSR